jgi:chemotaxis protein methyltransferase CheR
MYKDPDPEFEKLMVLVRARGGLDCQYYKVPYLKRRVAVRMRATGISNYKEYNQLLIKDETEYDRLIDRLTINVSRFYRDPLTYAAMARKVIPALIAKGQVNIWSAGCANGEEPYSLAILWMEAGGNPKNLKILGTDVDTACLGRAKIGMYAESALTEVPLERRRHYFIKHGNEWAVKTEVRHCITFRQLDLTGEQFPRVVFDLILCRNVMIYFNQELQERLVKNFHALLAGGGYFILGKTEVLLSEIRGWFTTVDIPERIYQWKDMHNKT